MHLRHIPLVLSLLAAVPVAADTVANEVKKLTGVWIAAEAQRDGRPAPEGIGHQLAFNGDQFVITSNGEPVYAGTFTVEAASRPARITFTHTEGQAKGTIWEGIYRLEGRRLVICDDASDPTKERPTSFVTSAGSGHVLTTFSRQ